MILEAHGSEAADINKVAFDSSDDTRKRIACLIMILHESSYCISLNELYGESETSKGLNPQVIYLSTLKRLYFEARPKLRDDERNLCELYLVLLQQLRKKKLGVFTEEMKLLECPKTENDYTSLGENFEMLLMDLLNRYGFLMKDEPVKRRIH